MVESLRILVVDDLQSTRDGYREALVQVGFEVYTSADGERALQMLPIVAPQVVVLDLGLPIIDGWEVARRIKAMPDQQHIRILALTGHTSPQQRASAARAGCDAYLQKPCSPQRLIEEIERLTGHKM
jgi:two-component system, cell cycle response regulator DivK